MPKGQLTRKERKAKYKRKASLKQPLSRYRERDLRNSISGTYQLSTNPPVFASALVGEVEECTDVLYNFDQVNPFSLFKKRYAYPVLNGHRVNSLGTIIRRFTNFPIGYRPGTVDPRSYYPALLPTEVSDLAWATMARTNPNTPEVEVPSFVGELKDFLSLIQSRGAGLIRQAAQGYIAWRWVIRPLWSDMQKLLAFQKAVNRRAEMLHNLQSGKEIRKRVKLRDRVTESSPSNVTIHSTGVILSGKTRVISSERVWGTATWKIAGTTRLPQLGWLENEKFLNGLAAGTTDINPFKGGLNLSPDVLVTAWELMPWSWLIDWCTSYGDILRATRNAIPVTWSKVAVMRETISKRIFYGYDLSSTNWALLTETGPYYELGNRKERFRPLLLPFSLPCFIPLIEEGHWQILASLALASGRLPGIK